MRAIRPLVAAIAVGAILVTSGCGSSGDPLKGKSGTDIVTQAKQALTTAKSVHVTGQMSDSDVNLKLDVILTSTGEAQGSISDAKSTFNIVKTSDATYIKGDANYWVASTGDERAAALGGKWIKVPSELAGQLGDLGALTSSKELADQFALTDATRREGTTKIGDTKAVAIDGKNSDGDNFVLYVEDTKQARPIRVEPGKDSTSKGQLAFGEWGKQPDISAPADAIDLATVMQQLGAQ